MSEFLPFMSDEWEQLLAEVEAGEDVHIGRDDECVAVLISYERYEELTRALDRMGQEGTDDGE